MIETDQESEATINFSSVITYFSSGQEAASTMGTPPTR